MSDNAFAERMVKVIGVVGIICVLAVLIGLFAIPIFAPDISENSRSSLMTVLFVL